MLVPSSCCSSTPTSPPTPHHPNPHPHLTTPPPSSMAAVGYLDDDEYNPHPYTGGYDIATTYGSPLPPSTATCYLVSSPAAAAPRPPPSPLPQQPALAPPLLSPPSQPRSSSLPPSPPPPVAKPHYWPDPYDYGDAPRDQPTYATPEVFRGLPYLWPSAQCHSSCGRDYWRQCMRGLDYLFGHSDGYGERLIGMDCHGVPVYANRKGAAEDAVVVEVPPPATRIVEWHDANEDPDRLSNQLSWYGNAQEDTYAYAQLSYTSYEHDRSYEQSAFDETTWFPNQSFQEVSKEDNAQYQEYSSYDADNKIASQPIFCYNQHFGEQPLHVQVEPPETVPSHKLEYYENFSTYNYQHDDDNLESSRHSYEIQTYAPYDQLEPYRPYWSQNLGYYQTCTEGVAPEYNNHTLASDDGEYWDMSSLFMSPYYPQEAQIYEQSHGDENV